MDFLEAFGAEPVWVTCDACGETCMTRMCWACDQAAQERIANAEAVKAALATIPPAFAKIDLDAPNLSVRIQHPIAPKNLAERILASAMATLVGHAGSGKTTLAVLCMRMRPKGAVFVDAMDLCDAQFFNKLGTGDSELFVRARNARTLVLDELKDPRSDVKRAELERFIFARYNSQLTTIVTTGLKPNDLQQVFGDGTYRRLFEKNCALVVRLRGDAPKS